MIIPDWPAPPSVIATVTTRPGGVSEGPYQAMNTATHVGDDPARVAENRRLLRQQLQLPSEPKWLTQVHGTQVVDAETVAGKVDADAAFTTRSGVVCVVQTADCLPVFFCNTEGTRVAVAHAGWAGLVAGVLEAAAACFAPGDNVLAWLGPAISQPCFEVGEEVREAYLGAADSSSRDSTARAFMPSDRPGHWRADLYQLARIRLLAQAVTVYGGGLCTFRDSERFFSYRRDGVTGRMASLIYIKP